ncbi:Pyruvate dehydrogenase complex repressor [bioreactor metagenome]|uniref:Pyruvate dehydrogenase complex repressor n=1 Tax=bioreactor metagenome TaxID=1076179 RepID=A0A644Z3U4_9ZZZZ
MQNKTYEDEGEVTEKDPSFSDKAYKRVVHYFQDELMAGTLKRGEKLPPERDLADQLGVGRNSVREALRTLSLLGFITSIQGAGNFVSCDVEINFFESIRMMMMMGEIDYRQLNQFRHGLEYEAVVLAARNITREQLEILESLVAQMQVETDAVKNVEMDRKFHQIVSQASGNQLIIITCQAMAKTINEFIGTMNQRMISHRRYGGKLRKFHQSIVTALREHNAKKAARAMDGHFKLVDDALEDLYFGHSEGK